jgi:taurine dioxygenase
MTVVPENGGGDTLFASTSAAYDALSPAMKRFLEGFTAIHDGERLRGDYSIKKSSERLIASEHPVVRTHPVTNRKCLYVNRVYTSHIVGLSKPESDAVLAYLYQHMEQAQFQCRFKWRPGSIAFWDNRCTLHLAIWDYYPERRYAERVTLCGERPV